MKLFSFCRRKFICRLLLGLALLCGLPHLVWWGLNLWYPFPPALLHSEPAAVRITDCHGQLLMTFLSAGEQWYFPVALSQVSPHFLAAIIHAEDKNFYRHGGVDHEAVVRAVWGNLTKSRRTSGASTITMQVIRLLSPDAPRNWKTKLREAFRAWQLERLLGKREILELYINRTPYGSNLVGVEAAARKYFNKPAKELSLAQASLLAGLPQSPDFLRPDRYPERAWQRQKYVLSRLVQNGVINQAQRAELAAQPPALVPGSRPFMAPHFCFFVKEMMAAPASRTAAGVIRTTLDYHIQQLTEHTLEQALQTLQAEGIFNGAAVVIDNASDGVLAWVGSANFFDATHQGQINGILVARSPGSALKPFTYATAFDKGVAIPATVLLDIPCSDGQYQFQNYDKSFSGPVSAATALSQSLNIPAIQILHKIGVEALLTTLRRAGLTSLTRPADQYGLSLTLGGGEVNLLELTQAYAALARLGIYRPVRVLAEEKPGASQPILSAAAAYLLADILKEPGALQASGMGIGKTLPPFAWKTGTSSHNKDAWCFVYNPRYTIGVWVGNFDARPAAKLIGLYAAAPVACQIFAQLMGQQPPVWYTPPAMIEERQVCSTSGAIAIPDLCPNTITAPAIVGISLGERCSLHVRTQIDTATGYEVCPACQNHRPDHVTPPAVYERWETAAHAWLAEHGRPQLLPGHNPRCSRQPTTENIVIISPLPGSQYILEPQTTESQYVVLQAVCKLSRKLYWFADGVLLGACLPGARFPYPLRPGRHRLSCLDETGRESTVEIEVGG